MQNFQIQVPGHNQEFQDSSYYGTDAKDESDHDYEAIDPDKPMAKRVPPLQRHWRDSAVDLGQVSPSEDFEPDEEEDVDYKPRRSAATRTRRVPAASRKQFHGRRASSTTSTGRITKSKVKNSGNANVLRPFPCLLSQYGCTSAFTSKNEWKRHVSTQHIRLGYWRCDMCPPADPENPVYNDFNRKDLFTQHLRRMHLNHPLTIHRLVNEKGQAEISEEAIQRHQNRCYLILRPDPAFSACLFCEKTFEGEGSWDECMEHVGAHMENEHKARKHAVPIKDWHEDLDLRCYLEEEGLIEYENGKWAIGDGQPRRWGFTTIGTNLSGSSRTTNQTLQEHLFSKPAAGETAVLPPLLQEDDTFSEIDSSSSDVLSQMTLPNTPYAELLHKLMIAFCTPFYKNLRQAASDVQYHQDQEGSASIDSNTLPSGSGERAASTSNDALNKRRRASQEEDGDDQLGGNGGKRARLNSPGEATTLRIKYACLFYKRNPARYKNLRSCPGPGWDSVHRVKEHLYRCHTLSVQCDRCGATYDSDDLLRGHRRAPQGCEVRNFPVREGVTPEQEIKLRSRKRAKKDETEEEKWYRAYGILFPYDEPTAYPTPYYETSTCAQPSLSPYHEFLRLEMPAQMQQQLALEIEEELTSSPEGVDERLRLRLPTIVHMVHRRLFRLFEESRHATESSNESSHSDLLGDSNNLTFRDLPPTQSFINAADYSLDSWFDMNDDTFTTGFSLDFFLAAHGNQEMPSPAPNRPPPLHM